MPTTRARASKPIADKARGLGKNHPGPNNEGRTTFKIVTIVTLLAGSLLPALSGCSAEESITEPSSSVSIAALPGVSSVARPDTTSNTPQRTLLDPTDDLPDEIAGQVAGKTPLLTEQGVDKGTYRLPKPESGEAILTVNCAGPGRYTVTGNGKLLLSSVCTGHASANIRLPLSSIGTDIKVAAPGAFWIVILPVS